VSSRSLGLSRSCSSGSCSTNRPRKPIPRSCASSRLSQACSRSHPTTPFCSFQILDAGVSYSQIIATVFGSTLPSCTHTHANVYRRTHTHTRARTHARTHIHACTHACTYTRSCARQHGCMPLLIGESAPIR
jgi:hypothetical protein